MWDTILHLPENELAITNLGHYISHSCAYVHRQVVGPVQRGHSADAANSASSASSASWEISRVVPVTRQQNDYWIASLYKIRNQLQSCSSRVSFCKCSDLD